MLGRKPMQELAKWTASTTSENIGKGAFTNNVCDIDKGIPVPDVKCGGKYEQKRLIYNASNNNPAKTHTFQSLLEIWVGGGSLQMLYLPILKTWKVISDNTHSIGREWKDC